jgi:uncharacterized membrane protein
LRLTAQLRWGIKVIKEFKVELIVSNLSKEQEDKLRAAFAEEE